MDSFTTAAHLFESVIDWLRDHYAGFRFFTERDVVWTVQSRLLAAADRRRRPTCWQAVLYAGAHALETKSGSQRF